MEQIPISRFKATCLAVLRRVQRSGQPVQITRFGQPVAEVVPPTPPPRGASWLGAMRSRGRVVGDIVAPATEADEWEALAGREPGA